MEKLSRREREKLEREEAIISKAEELFCKHGFEKVSMADLAKESEYTKRTIYRYFTCKEDLVFAVALRGYKRLMEMIKNKSQKGNTGLEKIRLSYYAYYEFLCKFPQMLKLINTGEVLKSGTANSNMPFRQKYLDYDNYLFRELVQMFIDGKTDKSIRSDLEMPQLALSSIFTATGFFVMLSTSGNSYTNHFALDKEAFVTFTIEMFISSLRQS